MARELNLRWDMVAHCQVLILRASEKDLSGVALVAGFTIGCK